MLRSTFFAAGLFVALWGAMFLAVDKMVLNIKDDSIRPVGFRAMFTTSSSMERKKVFDPPEWAGFSLISIGAVTMLYAVALPKKQ